MSTIDERWNIVDTTRAFCQKVLPLVYDESLSYMEMVCKVSSKMNELIENNNSLPQYVKDLVKETVDSDEFTQIVSSVLMGSIINVKFPPEGITPAKGDGVTDDTSSIQACIDYASTNNSCIFMPSGTYVTNTLQVPQKVSIKGMDRYTTSIVVKGGNSTLFNTLQGLTISDITLNGNSVNQITEVNIITGNLNDCLINNVIFNNAERSLYGTCNKTQFSNVWDYCKQIITINGDNNVLSGFSCDGKPILMGVGNVNESLPDMEVLVFESVNDIPDDVETGTYIKILNVLNGYSSLAIITDTSTNDSRTIGFGDRYIVLQHDLYFNVGLIDTKDDLSTKIQQLIDNGVPLYFPAGDYDFHVTVTKKINIKGAGFSTRFVPKSKNSNNSIFNFVCNGTSLNNSSLRDFYTIPHSSMSGDVSFIKSTGNSVNDMFDFLIMENIRIENYTTGMEVHSRMIWSTFKRVWFYGCFYAGFYATGNQTVNLNTFYECGFNNNVNYGYYNDNTEINSLLNNFISCDFEANKKALAGVVPADPASGSIYLGQGDFSFTNCYFEHNTDLDNAIVINNFGKATFTGCLFVAEKNLINNHNFAEFIGCNTYEPTNDIVDIRPFDGTSKTNIIACSFGSNGNELNITNMQFPAFTSSINTLELGASNLIMVSMAFDTLVRGRENGIYFIVPTADGVTAYETITGSGVTKTLNKGTLYTALYKGGKLYFSE